VRPVDVFEDGKKTSTVKVTVSPLKIFGAPMYLKIIPSVAVLFLSTKYVLSDPPMELPKLTVNELVGLNVFKGEGKDDEKSVA
jgi:hypothetical protein